MTIVFEDRPSDSPYIERVTHGYTVDDGSPTRPAEIHWHMIFLKIRGKTQLLVTGPLPTAGVVNYLEGGELLWIKFKLGTFMPHLPTRQIVNCEMSLPDASSRSFWLKGSALEVPTYDNVESFVQRLVRDEVLVRDPVVDAVIRGHQPQTASRTVRHRFLQATGLSQSHIYQYERAQQAMALLQQGVPILDVVDQVGYADQPHLTRSLKLFTGYTPAQVAYKVGCVRQDELVMS